MAFLGMIMICGMLVFVLAASVEGFSARSLSRPWDGAMTPKATARSVALLRLATSQIPTKDSSSKGSNKNEEGPYDEADSVDDEEDDETEVLSLEDTEVVPVPASSSASVTTPTPPSHSQSKVVAIVRDEISELPQIPPRELQSATQPTPVKTPEADDAAAPPTPTVRSCLPELIKMTRPTNDPAVVLLHMLGVYLALQALNQGHLIWRYLASPSMVVVLLALLLTSSTSMLVNDYYDYKLGHDTLKLNKPLTSHKVPLNVAKRFTSYLYAAALLCVTIIPGAPSRLAVVGGLMLTFWYTQHLKPRTWLKNVVCASLIALSPLASGSSALAMLASSETTLQASGALLSGFAPILRVFVMLFAGVVGREMTMDINDVEDDRRSGVRTVPVKYGRKFASRIALGCTVLSSTIALSGPLTQVVNSMESTVTSGMIRRCMLAGLGSFLGLRRAVQVVETEGQDPAIVDRTVDEGLSYVVLLLASFI